LLKAEREALRQARRIITPHSHIAELFPTKALLLDWKLPQPAHTPVKGKKVAFPASTVGRKGAYELREVAEKLGLEVVTFGSELEGKDFWGSVQTQRRSFSPNWLDDIGIVVLPAYVEHKPRKLLEAIASGIPVIASAECGVKHVPGVITIPVGDVSALCEAIQKVMNGVKQSQSQ
jgi:glycosyltransferase involved in cell wall biosynthesis